MAEKSRPRIVQLMEKNMLVKCPHYGCINKVLKTNRIFTCKKCHNLVDLDKEYNVDEYY